jgi:hypothetical protein
MVTNFSTLSIQGAIICKGKVGGDKTLNIKLMWQQNL